MFEVRGNFEYKYLKNGRSHFLSLVLTPSLTSKTNLQKLNSSMSDVNLGTVIALSAIGTSYVTLLK